MFIFITFILNVHTKLIWDVVIALVPLEKPEHCSTVYIQGLLNTFIKQSILK